MTDQFHLFRIHLSHFQHTFPVHLSPGDTHHLFCYTRIVLVSLRIFLVHGKYNVFPLHINQLVKLDKVLRMPLNRAVLIAGHGDHHFCMIDGAHGLERLRILYVYDFGPVSSAVKFVFQQTQILQLSDFMFVDKHEIQFFNLIFDHL